MKTIALVFLLVIGFSLYPEGAKAQIIPDTTVGTGVTGNPNFTITGGTRPNNGPNLFHSFSQFSVPTGGSAYFNNAPDVVNIFSRVTGSSFSNIDGVIQANGNGNLFLINPAGIIFGPNSSLNIGGSFIGATANSIKFSDGSEFTATNPNPSSLLTISTPIGLQMGVNPGTLTNQSTNFAIAPRQTLALIGGEILLQGTGPAGYAYLNTPDGHIELGSVGSNSSVSLAPSPKGWAFDYGKVTNFRDIEVSQASYIDVGGQGGGTIQLQGNTIHVTDGSQIYTTTSGAVSGGGLTINAANSLLISGMDSNGGYPSGLFAIVMAGGSGDGGNITINTPNLSIMDGGQVGFEGYGTGNLGTLMVKADRIELINAAANGYFPSSLYSFNSASSEGRGGNISLNTKQLSLTNGGQIYSETYGKGNAGNVTIQATLIEAVATSSSLFPTIISVATLGKGKGGIADITTQQLIFKGNAQISAGTFGEGNGGDIKIRATEIYADRAGYSGFTSTGLNAAVGHQGSGNGGDVDVQTQQVTLLNGAQIYSGTNGWGKGGNVKIKADQITAVGTGQDTVNGETPSAISTSINLGAKGNTGNLEIETRQLTLKNGAQVSTVVFGSGNGGDINIRASDILFTGVSSSQDSKAGIFASVEATGKGNAGNIAITSDHLTLEDSANIVSTTAGIGNAGRIQINSSESIQINNSFINGEVEATGVGQGGHIALQTQQLQLNGGQISTATAGKGNAGELTLQADQVVLLNQSRVSSQSTSNSHAGNLNLRANRTTLTNNSKITTESTGTGNGGTVTLKGDTLTLRNRSSINVSTSSGEGGNIDLTLAGLLELRNLSQLNAQAGGTGNGGNINLNMPLVIGLENSDIIANALRGRGGNIQITTQGIFGLKYRPQLTFDNDITASSQFGINGTVQISSLSVDPSPGLIQLPANLDDSSRLIVQSCGSQQGNRFVVTGRGGMTLNPIQKVRIDRSWSDIRNFSGFNDRGTKVSTSASDIRNPIVESTDWQITANGQIELYAAQTIPANSMATCAIEPQKVTSQ